MGTYMLAPYKENPVILCMKSQNKTMKPMLLFYYHFFFFFFRNWVTYSYLRLLNMNEESLSGGKWHNTLSLCIQYIC